METRKSAQTGVAHIWHLWANDADPKICPKCALIHLARIYGRDYPKTEPWWWHLLWVCLHFHHWSQCAPCSLFKSKVKLVQPQRTMPSCKHANWSLMHSHMQAHCVRLLSRWRKVTFSGSRTSMVPARVTHPTHSGRTSRSLWIGRSGCTSNLKRSLQARRTASLTSSLTSPGTSWHYHQRVSAR